MTTSRVRVPAVLRLVVWRKGVSWDTYEAPVEPAPVGAPDRIGRSDQPVAHSVDVAQWAA